MLVPPRSNAIEFIRRPTRDRADLALGLDRADVVLKSLSYSRSAVLTLHSELGKQLTEKMVLPLLRGSADLSAALQAGADAAQEWLGPEPA